MGSTATASILSFDKKTTKPRSEAVKGFDSGNDGTLTGKSNGFDGTNPGTNHDALAALIDTPEHHAALAAIHGDSEATGIIKGALALAQHHQSGAEVSITAVIKQTTADHAAFSYRFLTDKCKPLLIESGVLVQINAKKYQWSELNTCNGIALTCNGAAMDSKSTAIDWDKWTAWLEYASPQTWVDAAVLYQAKRDPFCEIKPDGTIQRKRKPFTGELTTEEKRILREQAQQQAIAKRIGNGNQLCPAAAELVDKKQLETIERRAHLEAMLDNLKLWAKVALFFIAIIFVANSIGTGETPETDLPSGIHGAQNGNTH